MRHPMNIRAESADDDQMVPATAQFIYQAHDLDKPEMIGRLLQAEGADLMLVFTRTKRQAQRIADDLEERGFSSSALHGDMAQAARERALTKFRDGKLQVLVATDVAARGIDVAGVTHVVNYTCPEDEKIYLHRIGRTGRAGATGIAITFVDWADLHRWKMINKAHDLPFDEPLETYSSSEHFLHDQGIAPGIKGRIVPEGTVERKPRPETRRPLPGRSWPGRPRSGGRGQAADAARAAPASPAATGSSRPRARSPATVPRRAATATAVARAAASRPQPARTAELRSVGDDDLRAHGREGPQLLGVRQRLTDAAVTLRRAQLLTVCSGLPSLVGMLWNPIAAFAPRVNRTKYCITPESLMPTA